MDLSDETTGTVRAATGRPWVARWVWMVVRFVCVIRVPVCPVCVPAPPGVFLPVTLSWTLCSLSRLSLDSRSAGPVVVRLAERANERERELSWLSRCYRCMCKAGDARTTSERDAI